MSESVPFSFGVPPQFLKSKGSAAPSMRRKIVADNLAVLHHESNALDLRNVSDRISGHGNDVGKFAGFNGTNAILPAQHFRSVRGNSANNVKWLHHGFVKSWKPRHRGFPARFSRIEPAHVGSGRNLPP